MIVLENTSYPALTFSQMYLVCQISLSLYKHCYGSFFPLLQNASFHFHNYKNIANLKCTLKNLFIQQQGGKNQYKKHTI